MVDQYAVLGPYDFVTIVEAPDNETVAHLAVDLGSRGTMNVMTLSAISIVGGHEILPIGGHETAR